MSQERVRVSVGAGASVMAGASVKYQGTQVFGSGNVEWYDVVLTDLPGVTFYGEWDGDARHPTEVVITPKALEAFSDEDARRVKAWLLARGLVYRDAAAGKLRRTDDVIGG